MAVSGTLSPASPAEYAKPVSNRLNTTGRTLTIPLPVKSDGAAVGEVTARINADDNVSLSKSDLVERLGGLLDPATQQVIASAEAGEFVSISSLNAAGIKVSFDPGLQEVEFHLTADQHQDGEIRLARAAKARVSANASRAADVSGFINLRGGFDTLWAESHRPDARDTQTSGRLELESALRLVTFVFENRSVLEGDIDTNTCPDEARCDYQHLPGFKRQSSRLVYDMPEDRIRLMIGDSDPITTGFHRSSELLGVSLQKSDQKLSPGDAFVPTGTSSFRIERTSDVDVIVNGVVMQRLHLRPGNYNIRDLPLATGANNIELAITDDAGEKTTRSFTTYFDGALLAAGQSEWAVGAGLPSYLRDNERYYADDVYAGNGSLRYGLSDDVTGEAILHGDTNVVVAGLGFLMQSPWGVFGLKGAGSWGAAGPGAALDAHWDLVNFNGVLGKGGESLRLSAELRSSDFHTSGEYYDTQTGILYPEFNHWLSLFADYSVPIFDDTTASISARYRLHNDEYPVLSPYTVVGDRYGMDVSLSRPIADSVNASLTLGYSNESYLRRDYSENTQDGEIRVGVRVSMRTEDDTMLAAGYDSMRRTGEVSGYRSSGSGVGSWDASVIAQHRDLDQSANANASLDYRGNRAEVRVSHYSQADAVSWGRFEPEPGLQRTSLRVGTAIAFANDKIAIGAPVRGDAFAIVYPHDSIADREITIGEGETVRAVSDGLGPALVGDIPAYRPATVPVDVADLPLGYSLGDGTFDTYAPLRGGYDLVVGSSHSVTVYGTLLDTAGAPVALLAGAAYANGDPAHQVQVFTNAAGRFGAEGLGEGRWIIEMPADAGTISYAVDIPPGTQGLLKVGELTPLEQSQQ